jgi:hypothetical protein
LAVFLLAVLRLEAFYFFFFEDFFLEAFFFFAFFAAIRLTPFVDRNRSRGQVTLH